MLSTPPLRSSGSAVRLTVTPSELCTPAQTRSAAGHADGLQPVRALPDVARSMAHLAISSPVSSGFATPPRGARQAAQAGGLLPPAMVGPMFGFAAPSLYETSYAPQLRRRNSAPGSPRVTSLARLEYVFASIEDPEDRKTAFAYLRLAQQRVETLVTLPSPEEGEGWREFSEDVTLRVLTGEELVCVNVADLQGTRAALCPIKMLSVLHRLLDDQKFWPLLLERGNTLRNGNHRLAMCKALGIKQVWVKRQKASLEASAPSALAASATAPATAVWRPRRRRAASAGAQGSPPQPSLTSSAQSPSVEEAAQRPNRQAQQLSPLTPYGAYPTGATREANRASFAGPVPMDVDPTDQLPAFRATPRILTYE